MHGKLEAVNGGASLAAGGVGAFQSPLEIFLGGLAAAVREERRFFCFWEGRERKNRSWWERREASIDDCEGFFRELWGDREDT